jgi:hypothetical protein
MQSVVQSADEVNFTTCMHAARATPPQWPWIINSPWMDCAGCCYVHAGDPRYYTRRCTLKVGKTSQAHTIKAWSPTVLLLISQLFRLDFPLFSPSVYLSPMRGDDAVRGLALCGGTTHHQPIASSFHAQFLRTSFLPRRSRSGWRRLAWHTHSSRVVT